MKPKNDKTAPAAAKSAAQSNFRSMIKAAMAPRINPASTAEEGHAVVDNPGGAELGHADLLGRSAGRAERAVDQGLRPGGDVRQDREHDCRRVPRW